MKTIALIEKKGDGGYCIYTPDIQATIIGEGKTVAEAKADFEMSVAEVLSSFEDGDDMGELRDIEFSFKYDIASVFNYFDFINVTKFARWAGINASLMRQYKANTAYISEEQAKRIEGALHAVSKELSSVSL